MRSLSMLTIMIHTHIYAKLTCTLMISEWYSVTQIFGVRMASFQEQVEELMECPVCFKIPRRMPIECCRFGHLVCEDCRPKVESCPTCRGGYLNYTNTVAGYISLIVAHKCKFSPLGCHVKMSVHTITRHEKICPERVIRCAFRGCAKEMALSKFRNHALSEDCAIDLSEMPLYDFDPIKGMCLPYILNRKLMWDGVSQITGPIYRLNEDGEWRLMEFHALGKAFYFSFTYVKSKLAFVAFIMMADTIDEAEQYKVRVFFEEKGVQHPVKISFDQQVISIEKVLNLDGYLPPSRYLIIQYANTPRFFRYAKNDDDEMYTVSIPVNIEKVMKVTPSAVG